MPKYSRGVCLVDAHSPCQFPLLVAEGDICVSASWAVVAFCACVIGALFSYASAPPFRYRIDPVPLLWWPGCCGLLALNGTVSASAKLFDR